MAPQAREGLLQEPEAETRRFHGCCWEPFYMFAYCGLVGILR